MPYIVTTPPAIEPVSLDQAKRHLHVDWSDFDSDISDMITAARQWAEQGLRRALITQTLQAILDIPKNTTGRISGVVAGVPLQLELPQSPVQQVALVEVESQIVTWTPLVTPDEYVPDVQADPGLVWLATNAIAHWSATWVYPGARPRIRVTYTAGYGPNATDVPYPIRQAILRGVAFLYENREADAQLPDTWLPDLYGQMRL